MLRSPLRATTAATHRQRVQLIRGFASTPGVPKVRSRGKPLLYFTSLLLGTSLGTLHFAASNERFRELVHENAPFLDDFVEDWKAKVGAADPSLVLANIASTYRSLSSSLLKHEEEETTPIQPKSPIPPIQKEVLSTKPIDPPTSTKLASPPLPSTRAPEPAKELAVVKSETAPAPKPAAEKSVDKSAPSVKTKDASSKVSPTEATKTPIKSDTPEKESPVKPAPSTSTSPKPQPPVAEVLAPAIAAATTTAAIVATAEKPVIGTPLPTGSSAPPQKPAIKVEFTPAKENLPKETESKKEKATDSTHSEKPAEVNRSTGPESGLAEPQKDSLHEAEKPTSETTKLPTVTHIVEKDESPEEYKASLEIALAIRKLVSTLEVSLKSIESSIPQAARADVEKARKELQEVSSSLESKPLEMHHILAAVLGAKIDLIHQAHLKAVEELQKSAASDKQAALTSLNETHSHAIEDLKRQATDTLKAAEQAAAKAQAEALEKERNHAEATLALEIESLERLHAEDRRNAVRSALVDERRLRQGQVNQLALEVNVLEKAAASAVDIARSSTLSRQLLAAAGSLRAYLELSADARRRSNPDGDSDLDKKRAELLKSAVAGLQALAGVDPIIKELSIALDPAALISSGLPSQVELTERFPRVRDAVLRVAYVPEDLPASNSFWEGLWGAEPKSLNQDLNIDGGARRLPGFGHHLVSRIASWFTLYGGRSIAFEKRPPGSSSTIEAGDIPSVLDALARAEHHLFVRGDLDSATREINRLSGWSAFTASDWTNDARRVLTARMVAEVLETLAAAEALKTAN